MEKPKKKNRAASALGKLGGRARMGAMTPKQRSALAKKAGQARWAKRKNGETA